MPQVPWADVWHTPMESQHPSGHVFASHTHLPCELHSWFVPQAAQTLPLAPHCLFVTEVTHWPLAQHPLQLLVPPHEHAPMLQVSPAPHWPQLLPPEPQTVPDCAVCPTHVPSDAQQPFGHDAAVHPHVPVVALHA